MILKNAIKSIVLSLVTLLSFTTVFAGHESGKEEKFNVGEMIMHHIKDAHEWHLWGPDHGGTAISLPIILVDGGIKVFSSAAFYEGETVTDSLSGQTYQTASGKGAGYAMFHEKIYKLNA